jgi:hypothetical protein
MRKMKRPSIAELFALATYFLIASTVVAQSTGSVHGLVKDTSGSIVPGARVVLTNAGTKQETQTLTNGAGAYAFAFVSPGEYALTVDHAGFNGFVRDKIPVDVAASVVVDVTLQVGTPTQTVTVSGAPDQLQAATSDLGQVVDNSMMNAMPLSSRNFTQILALSPGVTAGVIDAGALGRNSVNISANGARNWDNNVVMNGMNADNPMSQGFDDAPDKTGIPIPSPDAIEEFKVQTGLYDAEYGKEGGGSVNIVTKSGTNQFHGTAFEFFRNTALDANSFFQNASGAPKPTFRQNQYGGTLGGPVVRNKLLFFVSYEGTDQANGVSSSSNQTTYLPVMGNRSRQALGAIYGGQSGAFGGVAVAPNGSNINPVALSILNAKLPNGEYAVPSPCILTNATTGYCPISSPALFHEKQIIANGDFALAAKQRLSLKTLYSRDPTTLPFQVSTNVLGFGETDYHANTNLSLSYTYTLTPTLVNEIRAGYSRSLVDQLPVEPFTASSLGITPPTQLDGMPSINITGLFSIGTNRNNSQLIRQNLVEISDTLSKVIGRHQLRFGGSVNPSRFKYSDLFAQRGEIDIQSFPDFLLGMSGTQNGSPYSNLAETLAGNGRPEANLATNNFALFAQDDFRVNDQLTLNLGLRYQFNGQPYYTDGKMSNWDFRLFPKDGPPVDGSLSGLVLPANVPSSITIPTGVTKLGHNEFIDNQNWLEFSPRIGLAWRPIKALKNTVVRVGYGLFWSFIPSMMSIGTTEQQPFYASVVAGGATNPNVTFQNPFPSVPPLSSFPLYQPVQLGTNQTTYPYDPEFRPPHTNQYSGNVQTEIRKILFTAGYVGSQSTNIESFGPLNQAGLASPSNPIHGQTTNTLENLLLRVPFIGFGPGYDSIGDFMNTYCISAQNCLANPYGGRPYWSRYNSVQFSANRRFSNGIAFSAAYTWYVAIDIVGSSSGGRWISLNGPLGDFHNPAVGLSDFNRTNVFTASYLYDIPRLKSANKAFGMVVNGWSLSGVVIIESGLSFSIVDTTGGSILGVNSGVGSLAEFAQSKGASDVPVSSPTLYHYFNTSVFAPPPMIGDGTGLGNAPRNFMAGPGFWNTDLAILKVFPIREPTRLEFRAEFFNLFNHPNFANPGSDVGSPQSLGVISSTISSPRILQLALRIRF